MLKQYMLIVLSFKHFSPFNIVITAKTNLAQLDKNVYLLFISFEYSIERLKETIFRAGKQIFIMHIKHALCPLLNGAYNGAFLFLKQNWHFL